MMPFHFVLIWLLLLAFSDGQDFYELRERIGEGTSGVVRRAINRATGKQVAVKVRFVIVHDRVVFACPGRGHPFVSCVCVCVLGCFVF